MIIGNVRNSILNMQARSAIRHMPEASLYLQESLFTISLLCLEDSVMLEYIFLIHVIDT